jgi:hypothetical protein
LKDDDDNEKDGAEQGAEQPVEREQLKLPGSEINEDEYSDADQHLYRSCSPDKKNSTVDDE